MRLMPVSPPSAGVADQALPAVDWPGGLAPSSARQGSLQASLRMVLVERVLLSSPPASGLASGLASELASRTQSLLQPLAQVSRTQSLLQPLAQVSPQALVQVLTQALLRSSGRASLV